MSDQIRPEIPRPPTLDAIQVSMPRWQWELIIAGVEGYLQVAGAVFAAEAYKGTFNRLGMENGLDCIREALLAS